MTPPQRRTTGRSDQPSGKEQATGPHTCTMNPYKPCSVCVAAAGSVLGEWADDDELRAHLVNDHGFSASLLMGHKSPGLRHVHRYEHRWELDD